MTDVATVILDPEEAEKLFSWIGNIEIALENLQRLVVDYFADEAPHTRRALLEAVIGQRQLWGERPTGAIRELILK